MVLSVQFGNEMPKHAMENISITKTIKGTHVKSPCENNAHLFFYHKGIVHFEFLQQGQTVNQHYYFEVVCRIRPELWPDAWILHHDNAPAHDALAVWEFLAKKIHNKIGPSTIFARFGPM
jgi:hypothetical protein